MKAKPTASPGPRTSMETKARVSLEPKVAASLEPRSRTSLKPKTAASPKPTSFTPSLSRRAAEPAPRAFPIELEPARIQEALDKIRDEVTHWAKKGRYTRVRFKFRGRQLLPDIPLAAVVAAEGLSFYWAGLLRILVANFAGSALLDVELVNDSEKVIQQGKEALLSADSDKALELFRRAAEMDRDNANAHLNVGVVLKLRGDKEGARVALEKAKSLDPNGPAGMEAIRLLSTMPGAVTVVVNGDGG